MPRGQVSARRGLSGPGWQWWAPIPLVLLLRALRTFLGRRYLIIDASGIHLLHGSPAVSLPWAEVMAVGLGYEQAPVENKGIAVEILTPDPGVVHRYPKLKPYWTHQPPPWVGLPPTQWRFPLPPVVAIASQVEWGGSAHDPHNTVVVAGSSHDGPTYSKNRG